MNRSNRVLDNLPSLEYNSSPDEKNPVSTIDAHEDADHMQHEVQSTGSGQYSRS